MASSTSVLDHCLSHRKQYLILGILIILFLHLFLALQPSISSTERLPLPSVPASLADAPLDTFLSERPKFLDSLLSFPFESLIKAVTDQDISAIQSFKSRLVTELIQHELLQPKPLNDSCTLPPSPLNCSIYPALFTGEKKGRLIQTLTFNYDLDALEIAFKQYSDVVDRIILFQSFPVWEILKTSDRFREFEDVVVPILIEEKRGLAKREDVPSSAFLETDPNAQQSVESLAPNVTATPDDSMNTDSLSTDAATPTILEFTPQTTSTDSIENTQEEGTPIDASTTVMENNSTPTDLIPSDVSNVVAIVESIDISTELGAQPTVETSLTESLNDMVLTETSGSDSATLESIAETLSITSTATHVTPTIEATINLDVALTDTASDLDAPLKTLSGLIASPTDIPNDVSSTESTAMSSDDSLNVPPKKSIFSDLPVSDGSSDGLSSQGLAYRDTLAIQWQWMLKWNEQSQYLKEDDIIGFAHVQNIPNLNHLTMIKGCKWNLSTDGLDIGVRLSESQFGLGNPTFYLKKNVNSLLNATEGAGNDSVFGGIQLKNEGSLSWRLIQTLCESTLTVDLVTALMQVVLQNSSLNGLESKLGAVDSPYIPRAVTVDSVDDAWPWFYTCNKDRYPQYSLIF
jgi:hypothetical protein